MIKTKVDASILLLVLILALLGVGIFFTVFSLSSDPINESLTGDRVINTLFVIEDNGKPLSSFVFIYHPATKRAAVFDIPGSLGLIIQRINRLDRIDTVYDPRRISHFENEIEGLLGIDISYSIVISLEDLGRITDLLGGVELFIPSSVEEYHNGHIRFPSGLNILDGDKAMVFVTYELPDESSDLANFRRQRFFMGLIRQLGEQNQFLKNPQVANLFHSFLRTGMNQRTRSRLFDEFAGINTDRVSVQSVGGTVREVSGQHLIFPHWDGSLIKEIVRQTIGGLALPLESFLGDRVFTVEVLNGTTTTGLAGRTAELLRSFGYEIASVGNADRNDYDRTVIFDRSGYDDMVRRFGDIIRCTNIRFVSHAPESPDMDFDFEIPEYRSDFTLILGRDFNGRYVSN
ncbi:MAG: LCP family protein [Treponema sp.]|nr:LCP family protein [Treponema sp.]